MKLIDYIFKIFGYYKLDKIKSSKIEQRINQLEELIKTKDIQLNIIHDDYKKSTELITLHLTNEFNSTINKRVEFQLSEWKQKEEKNIRKDSISRSKSVTTGQIIEHFAPYHPDFKYNPKDARFLGSPIDLIIYNGLYDNGKVENIIFMEIKTGKSTMSSKQRSIKKCIENGDISFELFNIQDDLK